MVDKKTPRYKVLCPQGHEIVTRKTQRIQCRECAKTHHNSRFGVQKPEENNVPQQINN